jgi:predicted RNase H-like HicB family nuclease
MNPMKELNYYIRLEYPFRVEPDPEGGFVASIPDLPGCYTSAETKQKVLERLEETKTAWLESYHAMYGEAPEPNTPANFSGRVLLRLPKYLHKKLHDGAKDEGVSVNQYLVVLLAEGASRAELARTGYRSPGGPATGIQRHVRKEVSEVAIGIPRARSRKMEARRKQEERESRGLRIGESPGEFRNATKRKKSNPSKNKSLKRR